MDYVIFFGLWFVLTYVAAFLTIMLLGNFLGLSVPDFGGLLWRTGVLAGATVVGAVVASMVPVPFAGILIPSVLGAIVLVMLFEMEFLEEFWAIVVFLIAYAFAQLLIAILLGVLLSGVMGG
ncbi:MAG: hypothetical protein ACTS3F_01770 [Phycisphaerales bacterium]